ncbi:MAG: peptide chain release factor N(5)-glutamine methyltransferase [Betaproteobacteria bacterium]|nr:peptide chain release factor N(5)-glutamine methyltransferase [Betaproteobacteria bacterium]
MNTIADVLAVAREKISISEAKLLLRHVLTCNTAYLEAHREEELSDYAAARFADLLKRRAAGQPIAYLTGLREFYGRNFAVSPPVLIPRPETELLVELGIAKLSGQPLPRILDLGTGSGCIAVSLALELAAAMVTATDISPDALAVARRNAADHAAALHFAESDWFAELDGECFDLIVANPPYIPLGDSHLSQGDLRFEPPQALASGADGMEAIRRIIAAAPRHIKPGGWLLFEHGYDQASAVRSLLEEAGYVEIEQHRDLSGIVRVSGGRV